MEDALKRNARKLWLDALRALPMLFVIFGHLAKGHVGYFVFTSPVKLPLFFAVSGYLFKDRNGSQKEFYKGLFVKLIVPWLVLSLIPVAASVFSAGAAKSLEKLVDIFTGVRNWYMPCCIIAEILFFYIKKALKKRTLVCAAAVFCAAAGFLFAKLDILNICMINRAFIAQSYILIGYLIKQFEERLKSIKWGYIMLGAGLYIALGVFSLLAFPGKAIDVHMNVYYCLPFNYLMIVTGCLSAFLIAMKSQLAPKTLAFIGQNTLVYYMCEGYAELAFDEGLDLFHITLPESMGGLVFKFICVCVICAFISVFFNRFLPELVGKKRKNRKKLIVQ